MGPVVNVAVRGVVAFREDRGVLETDRAELVGLFKKMFEEAFGLAGAAAPKRGFYSTAEVAEMLGKAEWTVREWCRLGRINAVKARELRGKCEVWKIPAEEVVRYQDEGLLPIDPSRNLGKRARRATA
jgi:hypothetical protein